MEIKNDLGNAHRSSFNFPISVICHYSYAHYNFKHKEGLKNEKANHNLTIGSNVIRYKLRNINKSNVQQRQKSHSNVLNQQTQVLPRVRENVVSL